MQELWLGLDGLSSLFLLFPADILAAFGIIFIALVGVAVKRIFFS